MSRGYRPLGRLRLFGAQVHMHWSVLLAATALLVVSWRSPLAASAAVFSYFGLILLHEAGHAWMAQRIGYRPMAIYLGVFHGLCEHESPESQKHASLIAWGGVAAQLLVALPLIALAALTPAMAISGLRVVITVLGYYSLLIAAFNLAPASFLDGGQAWRLLPILAGERRRRHKVRDAASRGIRRVK